MTLYVSYFCFGNTQFIIKSKFDTKQSHLAETKQSFNPWYLLHNHHLFLLTLSFSTGIPSLRHATMPPSREYSYKSPGHRKNLATRILL